MKKLVVKESSRVAIEVMENGKRIEKIACGKRAKLETVKEIIAKHNIEIVDYKWKLSGVGGAGVSNSMYEVSVETFMNAFC